MDELEKMYNILVAFLGESKNGFDKKCFQYQFPCPRCIENKGNKEATKFNLECNIAKMKYNCWSCSSEGDDVMHGSIIKLIKLYGNERLLKDFKDAVHSFRESKLYSLNFSKDDFNIDTKSIETDDLTLPKEYKKIIKGKYIPKKVIDYLSSRGIGYDIIEKHNIGYVDYSKDNYMSAYRIYIPSYDKYGDLNYWTGRDYMNRNKVVKYFNPKVERKGIIFNEEKIQWDADVTLVEGPFDHIVVPNSIPLLGKSLNKDFKLYWEIIKNANANVNIFLDNDIKDNGKEIYSRLNHGRLYGKIRYIYTDLGKDPSEIYQNYGNKGIINCLQNAKTIPEYELFS